ncbi:MAG: dicarboxylate/amino acid:cation symporter [Planctomycetes bacterium]|nr:dicarboxylate/amino acid:cation symporter [Planctomycetota bacterium]
MSGGASSPLHRKVLIGLAAGAVLGAIANRVGANLEGGREKVAFVADAVAYPIGQLFLRLLFLVVVPLVFASLCVGVANLGDLRKIGRMGGRTILFVLVTCSCSALIGITLMRTFQPGAGFDPETKARLMKDFAGDMAKIQAKADAQHAATTLDAANNVLNMFLPRNVIGAIVNMEMLPLIVLALLFGIALTMLDDERRGSMVRWLETIGEAMVKIVGIAMKLAPFAVGCLVFAVVSKFGLDLLQKLAFYVGLVFCGYALQVCVLYPFLLRVLCRRSPIAFYKGAIPAIVTAFSTSSSSATLPTTLRVAQQELGMRKNVADFVLPLGATMNMNGTALFEGALVLFVAQVFGVELAFQQQVLVVILCVFAAIGAAGIPGGSLPLIMIVMAQVGVPPDGIAIVLGVDRLLDMGRTVVNVLGDLIGAAWVDHAEGAKERAA